MPYVAQVLPWNASPDPGAAHCSLAGAESAKARAATQLLRYLELLTKQGPQTDADAATKLDLDRSTINARRKVLIDRGIVRRIDTVKNTATGVLNCRWGLA